MISEKILNVKAGDFVKLSEKVAPEHLRGVYIKVNKVNQKKGIVELQKKGAQVYNFVYIDDVLNSKDFREGDYVADESIKCLGKIVNTDEIRGYITVLYENSQGKFDMSDKFATISRINIQNEIAKEKLSIVCRDNIKLLDPDSLEIQAIYTLNYPEVKCEIVDTEDFCNLPTLGSVYTGMARCDVRVDKFDPIKGYDIAYSRAFQLYVNDLKNSIRVLEKAANMDLENLTK